MIPRLCIYCLLESFHKPNSVFYWSQTHREYMRTYSLFKWLCFIDIEQCKKTSRIKFEPIFKNYSPEPTKLSEIITNIDHLNKYKHMFICLCLCVSVCVYFSLLKRWVTKRHLSLKYTCEPVNLILYIQQSKKVSNFVLKKKKRDLWCSPLLPIFWSFNTISPKRKYEHLLWQALLSRRNLLPVFPSWAQKGLHVWKGNKMKRHNWSYFLSAWP